jgi:predicted RNA-binding protein with PIN domain
MWRTISLVLILLAWSCLPLDAFKVIISFPLKQSRVDLALFAESNKRKKPSSSKTTVSSIPATAPRVRSDINIPVRKQIAWAKAYKRLMTSSGARNNHGITKKFRGDRTDKKEKEEYVDVNYHNSQPPAIFVDGYNIIGYITSMEGRKVCMHEARDCLISDLAVLQSATGWWIEVVFDAYKVAGPQKTEIVDSILVTYTSGSETADSFIERRFEELRQQSFISMMVATDDNMLRMIAGTVGSGYMSASMLLEEMRIAYKGWENFELAMDREADRHKPTFGDLISPEMKGMIASMMPASGVNNSRRRSDTFFDERSFD